MGLGYPSGRFPKEPPESIGMEPQVKGLTLNTCLTALAVILIGVLGYFARRIYEDTGQTHDAVIRINATMVKQSELQQVKADIVTWQQKVIALQQKETELQHRQDEMSLEIQRIRQRSFPKDPAKP